MPNLTPTALVNVDDRPSSAPTHVSSPEDAFRELWAQALRRCEQSTATDSSQWSSLLQRMDQCHSAEDVCVVLEHTMLTFERFRGVDTTWRHLRNKYLKPAVEVLLLFSDAIAETASYFPNVPGGKAVFVAFGVLLQATKGVTAYYDALIALFEELNLFLESLRARLQVPSSLGPASKTIAITILAHLLDALVHAEKLLSKRPWLGRLARYGRALIKDATMQEVLYRLRTLTDLEMRAMTSEIRVDALQARNLALATQATISQVMAVGADNMTTTNQLLSELQTLSQGSVQAAAVRGLFGRSMEKLIQGQKDLMGFLRAEREKRETLDTSRIFEILAWVNRADIEAQSPEGCMKGTRVKVLKDLRAWSHESNAPRIYWLNGMAGTGKSAIARSFCHLLLQDNLLGGSFFCSRGGSIEEGNVQRIIPTLAASLASRNLAYNENLLAELKERHAPIHWNLALQIERLLQTPLSAIEEGSPMLVLVVDALDECSDEDATRDLVSRLVRISSALPVKFFLTSRPEPHIRQQLEALDPSLGHVLRLHDIEQDIVQADIALYLSQGLRSMREPFFPSKWPKKADIETLARLSGKLFIYAFTALQYLRKDPRTRLPRLTGSSVIAGRPLTQPLDNIYSLILSEAMDPEEYEYEEIESTRRIIAAIVIIREPMTIEALGALLGMSVVYLRASLNRLYAVIYVPARDDNGVLSTFHISFSDFLTTSSRAPHYMLKHVSNSHTDLAAACFAVLRSEKLHFNVTGAASSYISNTNQELARIDDALRYACLHWSHHAAVAPATHELSRAFNEIFFGPKFLFWLEVLSGLGLSEKAPHIFEATRGLRDTHGRPNQPIFIEAAIEFVNRFSPVFLQSAPHIYLSALALCGRESIIRQCCSGFFCDLPIVSVDDGDGQNRLPLSATYSPDGKRITFVTEGGLEVHHGHRSRRLHAFQRPTTGRHVAFSKDGAHLVYVCFDEIRYISLLRIPDDEFGVTGSAKLEEGYADKLTCIAVSHDGTLLASGSIDNEIFIWGARTGQLMAKLRKRNGSPDSESVRVMVFSPDGLLVASGTSNGKVLLWDVNSGALFKEFEVAAGSVNSIDIGQDGSRTVCGMSDGAICLLNSDVDVVGRHPNGHAAAVSSICLSFDGTRIVTGSLDRTIRVWDIIGMSQVMLFHHIEVLQPIRALAFSPDGTGILCTTHYGAVQLWDIRASHTSLRSEDDCWAGLRLGDDGWLRGTNGELLLWLDQEQRKMLIHPHCTRIICGARLVIKLDTAVEGIKWTRCCAGLSDSESGLDSVYFSAEG